MSEHTPGEATLEQVLLARERRAQLQRRLIDRFGCSVISFTMNIPGPVKDSPLIRFAFRAGLGRLQRQLGEPVWRREIYEIAGCEALWVYDRPARELKNVCVALEESGEAGRLYDLDVIDTTGEKLSRGKERCCIICGGPVGICSRSRAHGLEALREKTHSLLCAFAAEEMGRLAAQALRDEVQFTPKPGLVDRRNTGAHRDMDLPLFERSIAAIAPFFSRFAMVGLTQKDSETLRQEGVRAEEAMFAATGGVNTHKGAIYSLALLLAGLGDALVLGGDPYAHGAERAAAIAPPRHTNGSAVREKYGIGGVRQEAVQAFPSLRACLAVLEEEGELSALLWSMSHLEDTNLYHRGGVDGAAFVRRRAAEIMEEPAKTREQLALELDDELIKRNLSPGGSADLLAQALFLHSMKTLLD